VQDAPVHCLAEIQNLSSAMHLIASNICCDSEISQQYCLLTVTLGLLMNNSHFWLSNQHCDRFGKCWAWG